MDTFQDTPSGTHRTKRKNKLTVKLYQWILAAVVIIAMFFFWNAARGVAYGLFSGRRIYIADPLYKIPANVKTGEVTHTFVIYNSLPRRLTLKVEPTCGCMQAEWTTSSIEPFSSISFQGKADTRNMKAGEQVCFIFRTGDRSTPYVFAFFEK